MTIRGLEGCNYLDKVGEPASRTQKDGIVIESEVDRVYVNTSADCIIEDRGLKRAIRHRQAGQQLNRGMESMDRKSRQDGRLRP